MKVGVIGAVGTTNITIKLLHKHDFEIVGVLGHEPVNKENISGLSDLAALSKSLKIPYQSYIRINEPAHFQWFKEKKPDVIFAVGFSQLLSDTWLNLPKLGCIGFHPTKLPQGRGRAPLAWIILETRKGAVTFFLMEKDVDSGPVFVQEPFLLTEEDDAESVKNKIHGAIEKALNNWLPQLKNGTWNPVPQDEILASYYGKRTPEDGLINWYETASDIDRLIKATTHPYPGAYTFFKNEKLVVWKSKVESQIKIKGVTGRILLKNGNEKLLVQCGEGLLWILDMAYTGGEIPNVGSRLGYQSENEIYLLWKEINRLKNE